MMQILIPDRKTVPRSLPSSFLINRPLHPSFGVSGSTEDQQCAILDWQRQKVKTGLFSNQFVVMGQPTIPRPDYLGALKGLENMGASKFNEIGNQGLFGWMASRVIPIFRLL